MAPRGASRPTAVIGLDIGTSAVKGLLVGPGLRPVATATRRYPLDVGPGGRVEADAGLVLARCRAVVRSLAASAIAAGLTVRAVCAGGSGDEAVWVDGDGRPVAPVPMSLDGRAGADGDALAEAAGGPAAWGRRTGLPVAGAYPLARYRWLLRTDSETAARVVALLSWPEALAATLGVEPFAEPTLAARSGAFDIAAGRYAPALLAAADAREGLLAPVAPTGAVLGRIAAPIARDLGVEPGALVVAGGFDQAMATLGAGVAGPGIVHVGAGSWEALTVLATDGPAGLPEAGYSVGPSIAAGGAWSLMASGIGGTAVAWLGRLGPVGSPVRPRNPGRAAAALAARLPDEPTGLLVLPELDGSAAPLPDGRARGIVAGLRLGDGSPQVALAMLEGLALDLAERVTFLRALGIPADEIRLTGGGSASRRWLGLRADATGLPVRVVRPADAGTAAAAALAAVAVGLSPGVPEAMAALTTLGRPVVPRPGRTDHWREVAERRARLRLAVGSALRATPGGA